MIIIPVILSKISRTTSFILFQIFVLIRAYNGGQLEKIAIGKELHFAKIPHQCFNRKCAIIGGKSAGSLELETPEVENGWIWTGRRSKINVTARSDLAYLVRYYVELSVHFLRINSSL